MSSFVQLKNVAFSGSNLQSAKLGALDKSSVLNFTDNAFNDKTHYWSNTKNKLVQLNENNIKTNFK